VPAAASRKAISLSAWLLNTDVGFDRLIDKFKVPVRKANNQLFPSGFT
jgi:hypothetical protein